MSSAEISKGGLSREGRCFQVSRYMHDLHHSMFQSGHRRPSRTGNVAKRSQLYLCNVLRLLIDAAMKLEVKVGKDCGYGGRGRARASV